MTVVPAGRHEYGGPVTLFAILALSLTLNVWLGVQSAADDMLDGRQRVIVAAVDALYSFALPETESAR